MLNFSKRSSRFDPLGISGLHFCLPKTDFSEYSRIRGKIQEQPLTGVVW